jgi:hypothetical protein
MFILFCSALGSSTKQHRKPFSVLLKMQPMLQNSRSHLCINCLYSKHFRVIKYVEGCKILQRDIHSVVYLKLGYKELNAHKTEPFLFSPVKLTLVISVTTSAVFWSYSADCLQECSFIFDTDLYVHCPFHYVRRYFHAIQSLGILRCTCITCNIPSLGSVVGLHIPIIQSNFEYVRTSVTFGRFLVSWNI